MGNVRYIRDYLAGNSNNGGSHWVEIWAVGQNGENMALGKPITSNVTVTNGVYITNGNTHYSEYAYASGSYVESYVQIDLGAIYDIKEVHVWHYWFDGRTYLGTKTEVSTDATKWESIFDSAVDGTYAETEEGIKHFVPPNKVTKTNKELSINIFNKSLEWVGVVDAVESFVHRTSWHEIANSELRIAKNAKGIEEMQIGRILVVNNRLDKALVIEEMEASLEDNFYMFTCIPLKGILNYRIAHPKEGGGVYTDLKQSEIMRALVRDNVVTTTNTDRHFMEETNTTRILRMASSKSFGDTVSYRVDYETGQLGDAVTAIANMYGVLANYPLGWNVYITNDFKNLEFDVWHGTHRHIDQTAVPPVVFSEEYGNIQDAQYNFSILNYKNFAYILWQSDDGALWETSAKREDRGETKGFNRRELMLNVDSKTNEEAKSVGQFEINKRPAVENFVAEIINNEDTMSTFEKDWFLGDIVTVQSKEIIKGKTISINAQITEIEEIYEGGLYSINATFGAKRPTIIDIIKNKIK